MKKNNFTIEGNIVDLHNREIFPGTVLVEGNMIKDIRRITGIVPAQSAYDRNSDSAYNTAEQETYTGSNRLDLLPDAPYIMPGFIDSHVHIESSMQTPQHFGNAIIKQGTVAIISDPHEIANVMGIEGIDFMLKNSLLSPVKIFFTIPSCVPATPFDLSGREITSKDIEYMAQTGKFTALSEMMNVPGVLFKDPEVVAKLNIAKRYNLPIDGHSPLLTGKDLATYINNGITTDHECTSLAEAQEKIQHNMKILIREGSAAKNYEALKPLIKTNPNHIMFCTDDLHEYESITNGHIKQLVLRSISNGYSLFDILRAASVNPIEHYKLDVGLLRIGDKADFITVNNLQEFEIQKVFINGVLKYQSTDYIHKSHGSDNYPYNNSKLSEKAYPATNQEQNSITITSDETVINNFNHEPIEVSQLKKGVNGTIKIISIVPDELLTNCEEYDPFTKTTCCKATSDIYNNNAVRYNSSIQNSYSENLESDPTNNIAKIVYINRYNNGKPQVAFCKGFGLKEGAMASSVSHDSHNIIAVGCSDRAITEAVNAIIKHKGGISVCHNGETDILPLPIGGIMSNLNAEEISRIYNRLGERAKKMGCLLNAPFMTLSFMSLVVIPELKIGEHGLFSYSKFNWLDQETQI